MREHAGKHRMLEPGRSLVHYHFNTPILQMGKLRDLGKPTEAVLRSGQNHWYWSWIYTRI